MLYLVVGLILTALSSCLSLIEKWKKKCDPQHRKKNKISLVIFLVGLGGLIVAFFAGNDAINKKIFSDKAAKDKQEKIDSQGTALINLLATNNSLIYRNLDYSKRVDSLFNENYNLSQKISGQTQDLADIQSGKGSYCYFDLGARDKSTNTYQYMLFSDGKNPMDNVVAYVADILSDKTPELSKSVILLGKLYPKKGTVRLLEQRYRPVKQDSIWLNVFFQTANREIFEQLQKGKVEEKWLTSLKIVENGKTIFEKVDKGFGKNFN